MPFVRSYLFLAWIVLALAWAVGAAAWTTITWSGAMAGITAEYQSRETFCRSRYGGDPPARDRCIVIMELERFQTRSVAVFNRALLGVGPPLAGFAAALWWHRRQQRKPAPTRGVRR